MLLQWITLSKKSSNTSVFGLSHNDKSYNWHNKNVAPYSGHYNLFTYSLEYWPRSVLSWESFGLSTPPVRHREIIPDTLACCWWRLTLVIMWIPSCILPGLCQTIFMSINVSYKKSYVLELLLKEKSLWPEVSNLSTLFQNPEDGSHERYIRTEDEGYKILCLIFYTSLWSF